MDRNDPTLEERTRSFRLLLLIYHDNVRLFFLDVNKQSMNEDNIIQSVIYSLNTLKNEYEKVLHSIVQSSEVLSLNKIEEKINLGLLTFSIEIFLCV